MAHILSLTRYLIMYTSLVNFIFKRLVCCIIYQFSKLVLMMTISQAAKSSIERQPFWGPTSYPSPPPHHKYQSHVLNRRTKRNCKTLASMAYQKPQSTLSNPRTPPFNLSRLHDRTPHTAQVGLEPEQSGSEAAQQSLSRRLKEVVEEDRGRAVV